MKHSERITTTTRAGGQTPFKNPGSRRVRIQEVAEYANVSLGTVSAVINENGRVSAETRDRVRQAMSLMGYQPDLYASNLARRHSKLLGLVVSNLQNPFFAETAQAIEDEAARFGFRVALTATGFSPDKQRIAVREFLRARVAGIAVMTSEYDDIAYKEVLASKVPTVFLDGGKAAETITCMRVDAESGMRQAVEHLIALGHRDLLYLRNSQQAKGPQLASHRLREQGFRTAIRVHQKYKLRTRIFDLKSPGGSLEGLDFNRAFIPRDFTAVVAGTDVIAIMACHELRQLGFGIPQDISVVGFDNIQFSGIFFPPLSTVDISRKELARVALQALLTPVAGREITISTQLIQRASTEARNPYKPSLIAPKTKTR